MDFKIVNDVLKENTDETRLDRGTSYYKDGFVEEIKYTNEDKVLTIEGRVASEFQNRVYNNSLVIDLKNKSIISGGCECQDCISRSTPNHLAICKHIVASTLYVASLLKSNVISSLKQTTFTVKNKSKVKRNKNYINKELLNYFKSKPKEKVNLDIKLELVGKSTLCADFRIGIDKMYVMKNLREFALARSSSTDLIYGIDFAYNPASNYFSDEDEKILDMIEEYGLSLSYIAPQRDLRYMTINPPSMRRLMECLQYKEFEFKFKNMYYNPQIIYGELPINIDITMTEEEILLKNNGILPVPISQKGDVVFYKGDIYLLSHEDGVYYNKLYSILDEFKEISFTKADVGEILTDVVPKLEKICYSINVDEKIKNNISKDLEVKYYFDLVDSKITCDVKFEYDGNEDGKFVVKDQYKEQEAVYRLYTNYFEKENDKYVFKGNDAQLYDFLSTEINRLKNIGEVYYSDKLKEKKIYTSANIKVGLGEEVNHYLDFNFEIDGVDESEYKKIMDAFKVKKRFYKLGDGNFVNLEDSQTKEVFKLMESLGFTSSMKSMKMHTSKALFINDLLTENKLPYINGIEKTKEIVDKFKKVKQIKVEVPKELNATLRDYQIDALNWFESLEYCGFGGLLADEMGLGKTIQTIAFLLSKKDKKTLIITPTSLVHNWKNEFEKFAPSMKVGIAHGAKVDRDKVIKEYNDYDVILTTYGSLRNDIEGYEEIDFDYCVIDEAQNIKNPTALSTDAVKSIKAKNKFALTGTPIENSLLELW
ncbi:MAG: SNF2 helicase associated domain-containing protein, partial [Peptostreptococcaceae bacterium]